MPITTKIKGEPQVLGVIGEQRYRPTTWGLPVAGARKGGGLKDVPVGPGLAQLREHTSYSYLKGTIPNMDIFRLPPAKRPGLPPYHQFFSILRGLGCSPPADERSAVRFAHIPLSVYAESIFQAEQESLPAVVGLAVMKAAQEVGKEPVFDWLANGSNAESAKEVVASLAPWMIPLPDPPTSVA